MSKEKTPQPKPQPKRETPKSPREQPQPPKPTLRREADYIPESIEPDKPWPRKK